MAFDSFALKQYLLLSFGYLDGATYTLYLSTPTVSPVHELIGRAWSVHLQVTGSGNFTPDSSSPPGHTSELDEEVVPTLEYFLKNMKTGARKTWWSDEKQS